MGSERPSIGVVGLGAFGSLMAGLLAPHADVVACDERPDTLVPDGVHAGSFEDVCTQGVILLAVNLQHLESVARRAAEHVRAGALVADVCSVKAKACQILERDFPDGVDVIGTHPLFGPQTIAEEGVRGQRVVLCPVRVGGGRLSSVEGFLSGRVGLRVIRATAEQHDRQMAVVQVLTHLVGHAVNEMGLGELEMGTLAYRRLLQLAQNVRGDSEAMFHAIQTQNLYAAEVRRRFLDAVGSVTSRAEDRKGGES